ncbi:MAG: hypothetical protein ACRD2B_09320 [Terriglobia bacterium]
MQPNVMIVATRHWISAARLAIALSKAGFAVDVVCPSRHPIRKTTAARRMFEYRGLKGVESVRRALLSSRPDIAIAADDLAVLHLYDLYCERKGNKAILALIERSLGSPAEIPLIYSRARMLQTAREEGVQAPESELVVTVDDLTRWGAQKGFPAVLKSDRSFGGSGVRVVHTIQTAQRAFRELAAPPPLARAVKRALLDRDATQVWPSLLRRRPAVSVQGYVPGREATSTVACWRGAVLASLHFDVLRTAYPRGPATVIRAVNDDVMAAACAKIAARLRLSGIHGFDFIREAGSGTPYLIEMNPRATQTAHLALGPGHDLAVALHAAITGELPKTSQRVTDHDTIALFPHEWFRDPGSTFLQSAYHDVPWKEHRLVKAGLAQGQKRYGGTLERRALQTVLQAGARQT